MQSQAQDRQLRQETVCSRRTPFRKLGQAEESAEEDAGGDAASSEQGQANIACKGGRLQMIGRRKPKRRPPIRNSDQPIRRRNQLKRGAGRRREHQLS